MSEIEKEKASVSLIGLDVKPPYAAKFAKAISVGYITL